MRMFAHYHGATLLTSSVTDSFLKDHFRHAFDGICFPTLSTPSNNENSNLKEASNGEPKVQNMSNYTVTRGLSIAYEAIIDKPVHISAGKVKTLLYMYTIIYTLH